MGRGTQRTRRGMGPSPPKDGRDNVGKGHRPAGTRDNLQRPYDQGTTEAYRGWRSGAWARRSEEGGVTSSEASQEDALAVGNAPARQRALGTRWFRCLQEDPDTEPGEKLAGSRSEGAGKLGAGGVWVSEHWSIIWPRKACFPENGVQSQGQNWTREIRPSRIVGGLAET
jgi:hypothetical protein